MSSSTPMRNPCSAAWNGSWRREIGQFEYIHSCYDMDDITMPSINREKSGFACLVLIAVSCLSGCSRPMPGASMSLGRVDYDQAFQAGRETLAQHFPAVQVDRRLGVITTSPIPLDELQARLLTPAATRKVATFRLKRERSEIIANLEVALQRQDSSAASHLARMTMRYDPCPTQTPAELEAASTAEQVETWTTFRRDRQLEHAILQQLYRLLNPQDDGQ